MLKVRRLSVIMSCSMSMMRQMCLLVAMLILSSVSGRGIDNMRGETEADSTRDDVINNERRQDTDTILCGRRPAMTSQPHVRDESADNGDNSDQLDKILGANYATHGEVPWQVAVYVDGSFRCGGVIINEFWVMTAAQCIYPTYTNVVTIVVGDNRANTSDSGEQTFGSNHHYIRAGYQRLEGELDFDYDLALTKLRSSSNGRGIQFNDYVQPICLPEVGESPAIGTQLTISGWGETRRTRTFNEYSNELKKMELPVFNHTVCKYDIYREDLITDRMLCAGNPVGSDGPCTGDQGGPATYTSGDIYILAGIVAVVTGCVALPLRDPVVLTSIPAHRQWIHHTISYNSNNSQGVLPSRTQ